MTYPCSGCGLRSCDGRCYHESCAPEDAIDAEVFAKQAALARAFWERRRAEQFTICDGDPLLKRRA